jgi:hypothetical protein
MYHFVDAMFELKVYIERAFLGSLSLTVDGVSSGDLWGEGGARSAWNEKNRPHSGNWIRSIFKSRTLGHAHSAPDRKGGAGIRGLSKPSRRKLMLYGSISSKVTDFDPMDRNGGI